jgi:hypothetical protein
MASLHLSVRLADETFQRLESESKRSGVTRSQLAKTLLDEGLRMERHPGIVFRRGAAGRRPALSSGPDVWEVIRTLRHLDSSGDELIRQTAELSSIRDDEVRTALGYYSEFADEIDSWISRIEQQEAEMEESLQRQQRVLSR